MNLSDLSKQLEGLASTIDKNQVETRRCFEKMDERIDSLNGFRRWVLGLGAGAGAVTGFIVSLYALWRNS